MLDVYYLIGYQIVNSIWYNFVVSRKIWNKLSLLRNFQIGRKYVKNHGLTPLLFGEIFHPKISSNFKLKRLQSTPN